MSRISGPLSAGSVQHGLVATVQSGSLSIYDSASLETVQNIPLDSDLASKVKIIRFCSISPARVLLASETSIQIYDAYDPHYHASIAGAAQPTGRIAHVTFLSPDEVLVFSDFNLKATIWHLATGLGTEIRDPKIHRGTQAYALRPESNHLALLTRPTGGKDIVVILEPAKREVEASFTLETQDALGVRWSPDGRWFVVWDSSHLGPGVWIYTADGQLFRRWMGSGGHNVEMGVRSCEWDTSGQWLLLGTVDGKIIGLRSRTFTPHFTFSDSASITVPEPGVVFQEQISSAHPMTRDYTPAQQPAVPPAAGQSNTSTAAPLPSGITHLNPSPNGDLLASVSSSSPTTVWLHQLPSSPSTAALTRAVIIHHHPIKALEWHPTANPPYLLMHCSPPSPASTGPNGNNGGSQDHGEPYWVHIYSASLSSPFALSIPRPANPSSSQGTATHSSSHAEAPVRVSVTWLGGSAGPQLLLSTPSGSSIVQLPTSTSGASAGSYPRIIGEGPEDAFDEAPGEGQEGESFDSADAGGDPGAVDDTFAFKTAGPKRGWGVGVT